MLTQGLQIMFVGMSVVFIMLSFIILAVFITSKIIQNITPVEESATTGGCSVVTAQTKGHMAVVIAAAISRFKKDK